MTILLGFRYTRSERRAVGALVILIIIINLGTIIVRRKSDPFVMSNVTLASQSKGVPLVEKLSTGQQKIELNSADSIDLLSLYGIGPVFSGRIIKFRNLLGGYYSRDQLLEVYGMDSLRYLGFYKRTFVDTNLIRKINMETVVFKELLRHPYIKYEMVKSFIRYRDYHGPPDDLQGLFHECVWPDSLWARLSPYLSLGQ